MYILQKPRIPVGVESVFWERACEWIGYSKPAGIQHHVSHYVAAMCHTANYQYWLETRNLKKLVWYDLIRANHVIWQASWAVLNFLMIVLAHKEMTQVFLFLVSV